MARRTLTERKKTGHLERITYIKTLDKEIDFAIDWRRTLKVYDHTQQTHANVTPKLIDLDADAFENFRAIHLFVTTQLNKDFSRSAESSRRQSLSSVRAKSSMRFGLGLKTSLDDILIGVGSIHLMLKDDEFGSRYDLLPLTVDFRQPFIRVILRKTDNFLLYEQASTVVLKDSFDAEAADYDNRAYDYLTVGRGKFRRRSEAETQTKDVLVKAREVNTTVKHYMDRPCYVSLYEMYDTYKKIFENNKRLSGVPMIANADLYPDRLDVIAKNPNFSYSAMVLERMLASNYYQQQQQRYRNMSIKTKMDANVDYKYRINLLYRMIQPVFEECKIMGKVRKAVSAISFCHGNGDLIAVGYGFYSHSAKRTVTNGNVCIWSVKNPCNPERTYSYPVPVTAVEFSPFLPFLIAIGMYDGTVQVRNITNANDPPVAISQRTLLLTSEPVTALQWFHQPHDDSPEIDPFLVLTRDGKIAKFRIIASPYLLGMRQMMLNRIEGNPEGVQIKSTDIGPLAENYIKSNRHPGGLNLVLHPVISDLYFILTDEGCIQKCSLNHTHQYLDVLKVHEGAVNHMDYSPWSPRLFLTCGNDWTIRIWLEGIFQPLITLTERYTPIHCALWSRTNSTVIISINRETVDMWDLRRNLLAPVSSTKIDKSFHTIAKVSLCGRSLAIGNERGNILMCSFEDMPFPSHNQYGQLEKAIYKAIETSPSLLFEFKNIGYFGYEIKQKGLKKKSSIGRHFSFK
ncbi:dynein axonemal intermediate chain 4-like [Eurosta solidaginis]|uniref:dynein axonemal intermediate chain 4-like n=1 Tax=Eurosta solidaginis TaxID=178769 RepID=UPI003531702E